MVRPRATCAVPCPGRVRCVVPGADRTNSGRGTVARHRRWGHLRLPLSDGSATIEPWVANLRANMMPDGVRALADADLALDQFAPASGWRRTRCWSGGGPPLLGATDRAVADLGEAVDWVWPPAPRRTPSWRRRSSRCSLRGKVTGAGGQGTPGRRMRWSRKRARPLRQQRDRPCPGARVALHEGAEGSRVALVRVHRLRPMLDHGFPWLSVQVGLELTRSSRVGEAAAARTVFVETDGCSSGGRTSARWSRRWVNWANGVTTGSGAGGAGAMSLTGAELRLLPYLATHLTFGEIGQRLYVSPNTVKSEASRSTASSPLPPAATPSRTLSRPGSWKARSTRRGRMSSRMDEAPGGCGR